MRASVPHSLSLSLSQRTQQFILRMPTDCTLRLCDIESLIRRSLPLPVQQAVHASHIKDCVMSLQLLGEIFVVPEQNFVCMDFPRLFHSLLPLALTERYVSTSACALAVEQEGYLRRLRCFVENRFLLQFVVQLCLPFEFVGLSSCCRLHARRTLLAPPSAGEAAVIL